MSNDTHWMQVEVPPRHAWVLTALTTALIVAVPALVFPFVTMAKATPPASYVLGVLAGISAVVIGFDVLERVVKRYYMD